MREHYRGMHNPPPPPFMICVDIVIQFDTITSITCRNWFYHKVGGFGYCVDSRVRATGSQNNCYTCKMVNIAPIRKSSSESCIHLAMKRDACVCVYLFLQFVFTIRWGSFNMMLCPTSVEFCSPSISIQNRLAKLPAIHIAR
jgi:hypothetical protein